MSPTQAAAGNVTNGRADTADRGRDAGREASRPPLLAARELRTHFPIRQGLVGRVAGTVKAVDGVSFEIRHGETLGLVGESGCGKTTVGRSILRLIEPSAGEVLIEGRDIRTLSGRALRAFRRRMQIVFQDPYSSLNPRQNVASIVGESLTVHGIARGRRRREIVDRLLAEVGLDSSVAERFPHEFSGGQRQRIGIARALALSPDFIVLDEPVSALDVSIQAQIVNLLQRLKADHGLSYLFIAHDLHVVEHISDRVAVMYLGRIVETAPRDELYGAPLHPYTRALLSANPVPNPEKAARRRRILLPGTPPSPANPPSGCPFHPRCPAARADEALASQCRRVVPPARTLPTGHTVNCLLYGGGDGQAGTIEPQPASPAAWEAIDMAGLSPQGVSVP